MLGAAEETGVIFSKSKSWRRGQREQAPRAEGLERVVNSKETTFA
jgi:hypothetical protein